MAFLEVKNLEKSFGDTKVLRDISFSVEKGEILSVIGSSGSGKTTLLRCLNFLETAQNGTVTVGGEVLFDSSQGAKVTDRDIRMKRLHFGLVFQQFNLFPQYTVMKNITLAEELLAAAELKRNGSYEGLTSKREVTELIRKKAAELLRSVGLAEKADAYPCNISGGQQQRVAIARALALKPDVLCFDEPTSALDPELTGEVLRVIRELKNSDRTMIIVTHEIEFARDVSDKVMFMADGVIEEFGTPAQVIESPHSERTKAFLSRFNEK